MNFGTRKFNMHRILGDLRSEVRVPPGKSGKCEITKELLTGPITVVSSRNSLFTGFAPCRCEVENGLNVTALKEDGLVWMCDHPQEIFLHHFAIDKAYGCVLIGGLGVGYSARVIARKGSVEDVTVVEINRDVIKLVAPHIRRPNLCVVQADLWQYLKTTTHRFNFVFMDIWRSTGEMEFQKTVAPLRALAKRVLRPGGKIMCWGEEEMRGQIRAKNAARKQFNENLSTPVSS